MLRIDFDDRVLRGKLAGLTDALRDLTPAWPKAQTVLVDFVKKHFQTQGSYVGQRWAPLSPRYAAWKRKNYGEKGILHLTERLYGSLTEPTDSEHVFLVGPSFMEFGTKVPYAWAHQKGVVQRNLPARIVLPEPTKAEGERVVDVILSYLLKSMRLGRKAR